MFAIRMSRFGIGLMLWAIGTGVVCPGGSAQSAASLFIHGKVVDEAQRPVAGATVHLERDHIAVQNTHSGADGFFGFGDLIAGKYSVVAEKDGASSSAVQVVLSSGQNREPVALVLKAIGAPSHAAGSQAMEFADNPNFTIAGVTDWTAAGGHGSDVSLRTSEALNRETLTLKPAGNAAESAGAVDREKEEKLRQALAAAPESAEANGRLGKLYIDEGRSREALPFLQKAFHANPADPANEAQLAVALKETGDLAGARQHVEHALSHADNPEVHRAAGTIDEASGDPLRAVHEFAMAVQEDPSEQNYFAWGEELLQHRAVLQAKEVFEHGVKQYPKSFRLLTSLGAALFAGALYQQAADRLCEASDLNPGDPEPYRFMGKIELVAPAFNSCMGARLARFASVHPNDALANYFYAMDMWKQQGNALDVATQRKVEALLTRAVTIDPKCSVGFLQLGNLRASEQNYPAAITLYAKAIDADPQSSEAHYRLAVAYDRIGQRAKAKQEFALHDAINQQQAAETDRQRREIKQFVIEAERGPSAP